MGLSNFGPAAGILYSESVFVTGGAMEISEVQFYYQRGNFASYGFERGCEAVRVTSARNRR